MSLTTGFGKENGETIALDGTTYQVKGGGLQQLLRIWGKKSNTIKMITGYKSK